MGGQSEQDSEAAMSSRVVLGGSNRIAPALNETPFTNVDYKKPGTWRDFLSYVGPGFLVSMAYLDPGNCWKLICKLELINYRYELLWMMLIGLLFALIIRSPTENTFQNYVNYSYPLPVKYCLWLLAEVPVIGSDIAVVVGTAFALNLLFHIPSWAGVLMTGFSTLLRLGLQRFGVFISFHF